VSAYFNGRGVLPDPADVFPLSIHASQRYLVDAQGSPFFVHGDTAWSIVAQLTNAEIDTYLADRAEKGFNLILFNAPEPHWTSQTPVYNNVDGVAPFGTMSPMDWTDPVEAYWQRVDYVVNSAKALGMVCLINPAYSGYEADGKGWMDEIDAASAGDLQTYGAWLANRYTQGNIIWSMGGDMEAAASTRRAKQWNIVTGMRTVRTTDLITAHHLQPGGGEDAYTYWGGGSFPGFNLNWAYGWEELGDYMYELGAIAYARSMPFLGAEFQYEQEGGPPAIGVTQLRRQSYGILLSGACGQNFGNSPIWHFESPNRPYEYTGTWESNLDSTGSVQQQYVKALFAAYQWWKLEPKTDASLVTTSLSTNANRIYPALANDGSFAMIYTPGGNFTAAMSQLAPASVRGRWYNPTDGTYAAASGSPYANSGTQAFTAPGERVLVLDAA